MRQSYLRRGKNAPHERRILSRQRPGNSRHINQPHIQRRAQIIPIRCPAIQIRARIHPRCRRMRKVRHEMPLIEHKFDRVAVRRDPPLLVEPPKVAQERLQQEGVRTRREAVHRVEAAHDRGGLGVAHAALERREVVRGEILLRDDGVEDEAVGARRIFEIVTREVFAVCDDFELGWVDPALEAFDEVVCVLRDSEWIFSGRLLTAAPARIAEGCNTVRSFHEKEGTITKLTVDVRREVIQPRPLSIVERPSFRANHRSYGLNGRIIKRRAHVERRRERRRKTKVTRRREHDPRAARDPVLRMETHQVAGRMQL